MDGVTTTVKVAHVRLCMSRMMFGGAIGNAHALDALGFGLSIGVEK